MTHTATVGSTEEPFEDIVLGYVDDLRHAARRFVGNGRDAEDLVQETLLRAFAAQDRFRRGTNCRAWLRRIMTNSFINEYRRLRKERNWLGRREPMICPERRRAAAEPERMIMQGLLSDEVVRALGRLPDEFRTVVELADLNGLSYREVADRVGCPVGTVMSRLYRARRLLEGDLGDFARERGIARQAA